MKIGLFTDSHYSSQALTCGRRYNRESLRKIKEAYEYFKSEKADLVICLGDITDTEDKKEKEIENLSEIRKVIDASGIKTYILMGNHDAFTFTEEEFYFHLGNDKKPKDGDGLIFIDACYFSDGKRYMPGDFDWENTFYPYTEELEEKLSSSDEGTLIFMHQNIDGNLPSDHRLSNDREIRKILEDSKKVKAVYQGHFHSGAENEINGIFYITLPAMCENEGAYFIKEI